MLKAIRKNPQVTRFFWYLAILLAAILGQDILLEPFAGEAFGLSVRDTTRITAVWGSCVLAALIVAGFLENRFTKQLVVKLGAWTALAGFLTITLSGIFHNLPTFYGGVVLLGIGTGLSTTSNLSLMFEMTTASQVGLFIGAWGMSNAVSRLIGTVLSGAVRDLLTQVLQNPVTAYIVVFIIEAGMLAVSLIILRGIDVNAFHQQAENTSIIERAAMATDM
jgi:BCD family chlorophyll transporter-like MFS transporter